MKRMSIQYSLIIVICSLLVVSCKSSRNKDRQKLSKLESEINNSLNTKLDENKLITFIEATKKYADDYPSDSASPEYLFRAGRLAMNIQEAEKADQTVILFDKLLSKYPNCKDAPLALFMKAFYLENNMKNFKAAEETYREFLKKYPNHMLAPDAQKSIEYMGKPLEVIIKEFNEKEKPSKK
jgi:outer membrane protein assembly factor BamD (BamD/ComL family)